jgi:GDPmannose 4,6-dehydratase
MQWLMLQQEKPKDFVIATGEQLSVRTFLDMSAKELGITLRFEGEGVNEVGIVDKKVGDMAPNIKVGDTIVRVDSRYFRPTEVETLLGDASRAKKELGWVPEIKVEELCHEMVANDLDEARQMALLKEHGFSVNVNIE